MSNSLEFDFAAWQERLAGLPLRHSSNIGFVTSPIHLLELERKRDVLRRRNALSAGVPCDIFVIGKGEAPRRDMTQFGGLPYRPRSLAWPRDRDGNDLRFIAQIRFRESLDLTGPLPGDLLLLFMLDDPDCDCDIDEYHVEWQSLGISELVEEAPETNPDWVLVTGWGARFRAIDYPEDGDVFREEFGPYSERLAIVEGTKIGGVPVGHPAPELGRFLGAVGSIQPEPDFPWPWLNQERPVPLKVLNRPDTTLSWMDMGSINIYRGGERLNFDINSY